MEENKQHKTALPETEPIPSAQAPEALLDIRGLRVEYHTDEDVVYAVNGLDLTIGKGESLGLVGETGAGKTTTALSVLRLIADPPGKIMGGEIWFEGEDMLQAKPARLREIRGSKISVIFQDPMTSLNPVYSVGDQIAEVIHQHEKCSKEEGRRKAGDMLEMVGIPRARYDEYPHQFSGGMKQRVVIAMSIAGADSGGRAHHRPGRDHPGPGAGTDERAEGKAPYLPAADYPRPGRRGPGLRPGGYHVCR